jgi:hypothetical protein
MEPFSSTVVVTGGNQRHSKRRQLYDLLVAFKARTGAASADSKCRAVKTLAASVIMNRA